MDEAPSLRSVRNGRSFARSLARSIAPFTLTSVVPQHTHCVLASDPETPLNSTDLQRIHQHPREPERNLLRKLAPVHGYLEAVAKVYVEQLSVGAAQH